MFEFINDIGNYSQHKVGRDNFDWGFVSTARVSDGRKPYETAVQHPDYNDGEMVIVDCYDTIEEAKTGHEKWIKNMTDDEIPDQLIDCGNSRISQLCDAVGSDMIFKRVKSE